MKCCYYIFLIFFKLYCAQKAHFILVFSPLQFSFRTEREKYYKHIHKARQEPSKYMSLIIDGMDQKATSIPRFYRQSKSTSAAWKLQSHITGAMVHGRGNHLYVDVKEYPHDSNLTGNILLNILHKYSDTLPDVLYVQMDNCGRENKNQCVIGLCALLVELDVFRKVRLFCIIVKFSLFLHTA